MAVLAQQAVRLMSMAGSLGCADTALRLALGFAAERQVAGAPLLDVAHPRRDLAVASAALLAADAVALAAARACMSYRRCSASGRSRLARGRGGHGRSGPALRRRARHARGAARTGARCGHVPEDPAGCGGGPVIDASPLANLRAYAAQIPTLVTREEAPAPDTVHRIFALDAELPSYDPTRLDLVARGADPVLGALPGSPPAPWSSWATTRPPPWCAGSAVP
ncbi:hypothetical protein O1M54_41750 [Streptomyces diastatochromogenes]|nr:hypothetical protein [Streptomyces diastatochromogenes]